MSQLIQLSQCSSTKSLKEFTGHAPYLNHCKPPIPLNLSFLCSRRKLILSLNSNFCSQLTSDLRALQTSINSDLKRLQKAVQRHIKDNSKKQRRKKNTDPNRQKRAPSGFAKPALISPELCSFLNKPEGTEMARTEVTKFLTKYISDNNLQDQSNKRKILPDTALKSLLNVGTDHSYSLQPSEIYEGSFPQNLFMLAI